MKAIAASGYKNRNIACSLCDLPCLDNVYVLISEYLYVLHAEASDFVVDDACAICSTAPYLTLCSCTKRPSLRQPF